MDKWFHPTFYWVCVFLSILVSKSIHVSKRGPGRHDLLCPCTCIFIHWPLITGATCAIAIAFPYIAIDLGPEGVNWACSGAMIQWVRGAIYHGVITPGRSIMDGCFGRQLPHHIFMRDAASRVIGALYHGWMGGGHDSHSMCQKQNNLSQLPHEIQCGRLITWQHLYTEETP